MNLVWLIVFGLVLAAISTFFRFRRRTDRVRDLGAVSHQWIAEQRLETNQHARRP
jgi:LPXTG-motif cell wall-anchored protein